MRWLILVLELLGRMETREGAELSRVTEFCVPLLPKTLSPSSFAKGLW